MSPTTIDAVRPVLLLAAVALIACACSTNPGNTAEPTTNSSALATAPDGTPDAGEPSASAPAGQSETGWGTIWDALPDWFPMPDGAKAADARSGPVSGAYTVPTTKGTAAQIAAFFRDELDAIGYGTGLDGPLEDGSYTVWSSNGEGCDTLTTVLPRGDENLVTILYAAGCHFE